MALRLRRALRGALLAASLTVITAIGTGCSGSSEEPKNEFTGQQILEGLMGVGPAAPRFGEAGNLEQRLARTQEALKNSAIPAEQLDAYYNDLKPQSGDPLPAPRTATRKPSPEEISAVGPALQKVKLPSAAQYEKLVRIIVLEMERRAPGYLDKFGDEMQSGDPARVQRAMSQMKRTLIAVFESKALGARVRSDPELANALGVGVQSTGSSGGGTGGNDPSGNPDGNPDGNAKGDSKFDPVVVPNETPNENNTYLYDQYWVATRVGVGAYVGAVVVVGAVVWVAAVKGVGPFIPLANMNDQNPGDPLKNEMQIAALTKALKK